MSANNGTLVKAVKAMDEIDGKRYQQTPDPEVPSKATRRRYSAEYKLRVLKEADACEPGSGELGALLRREGLYSSHLATWRRQRERGELEGLRPKKRGRKPTHPMERRIAELEQEKEELEKRLEQAELIIDDQKTLQTAGASPEGERREHALEAAEWLGKRVGVKKACEVLNVPRAALYRRR